MTERQPRTVRPGCPQCGTAHEPDQDYCLECGRRLRGRDPWSGPPTWIWVVIGALVAMAVAGTIAGLATRGTGSPEGAVLPTTAAPTEAAATIPATTRQEEVPLTVTLESPDEPPPTAEEPRAEGPPTEPSGVATPAEPGASPDAGIETVTLPTGSGGGDSGAGSGGGSTGGSGPSAGAGWPAGQSGYTAVLASIPTSQGRGAADSIAQRATGAGLPEVGILDSSKHSSLQPGFWVVFSGVYSTSQQAKAGAQKARNSGFPDAYARAISA